MRLAALLLALALAGCASIDYASMSAQQIKATNGTISCASFESIMSGKGSYLFMNQDDTRKGATSTGKVNVTCGAIQATVDSNTGVPVPAGATTTTTTTVTPAK